MKVALIKARSGQTGGLEKYTYRIASAFAKKGAEVTLLTTQNVQTSPSSYSVRNFPVCSWPGFFRLEQFDQSVRKWLKTQRFDIIFGMDPIRMQTHIRAGNGVHAAFLKSRLFSEGRLKYEMCRLNPLHRKILHVQKTAFENPLLRKIFTNSYMVQRQVLQYYDVDPSKLQTIHNGVEWEEMGADFNRWQEVRERERSRLNLNPNHLQILFIGNGYERKGLDPLLRALSIWPFTQFCLLVIGKEKNMKKYQDKIPSLGLEGRVKFLGPQHNVLPFYQLADVLAIPSFYDPFANVTVEALAMGLCVISSKYNGGHEVLTSQNGIVIEDLLEPESIVAALNLAFPKTAQSAHRIRTSVAHLDFSKQLSKLVDACE